MKVQKDAEDVLEIVEDVDQRKTVKNVKKKLS